MTENLECHIQERDLLRLGVKIVVRISSECSESQHFVFPINIFQVFLLQSTQLLSKKTFYQHCSCLDISYYLLKAGLYRCGKNDKLLIPVAVFLCASFFKLCGTKSQKCLFPAGSQIQRTVSIYATTWDTNQGFLVYTKFNSLITFHPFGG